MTEIADLIAILGYVDERMPVEGEELREKVVPLVPAYRVEGREGWFRRLNERVTFPDLGPAMESLMSGPRYPSLLPRQVLAVAVAARAFPDEFGPGGARADVSLNALQVPGVLRGAPPLVPPGDDEEATEADQAPVSADELLQRATHLLDALVDPRRLPSLEAWPAFLADVEPFVSDQLLMLPRPCVARVVARPAGGRPVTVLETELCVRGVSHTTVVERLLEPAKWRGCSPWWCAMEQVALPAGEPGARQMRREGYLERVAAGCPDLFAVSVLLHFAWPVVDPEGKRAVMTYNMLRDQSLTVDGETANDAVDVDRGVIEVRQEGDCVHVYTTKRVRFVDDAIDPDLVAILSCWVGYGDSATDLIVNCTDGIAEEVPDGLQGAVSGAVFRFAELYRSCKQDVGVESRRLAERLRAGDYGTDAMTEDAQRAVGLAFNGWRKVATTWLDAAADLAGPGASPAAAQTATATGTASATATAVAPARPGRRFALRPPAGERSTLTVGDLMSPYDEKAVVKVPPDLGPGAEFSISPVDAGVLEGTAYVGTATATGTATAKARSVDVYLVNP